MDIDRIIRLTIKIDSLAKDNDKKIAIINCTRLIRLELNKLKRKK